MINNHCGKKLVWLESNLHFFSRKCQACGRVFTQRKRLKTPPGTKTCCNYHKCGGQSPLCGGDGSGK